MSDETCVRILREPDIVTARHEGRIVAEQAGFGRTDLTLIATVISELARNIVEYLTAASCASRWSLASPRRS